MNIETVSKKLRDIGLVQVSTFEHANSAHFGYYDVSKLERLRVTLYNSRDQYAHIYFGKQEFVLKEEDKILQKVLECINQLSGDPVSEEDLEAARLVREVRTLRLAPEDKLLIRVRDKGMSKKALEKLTDMVLHWLGEKNSGRVLLVAGEVELTKVKSDEDNQK